jgi:4-hydroxybenzoate polyprenyltransferase
MFKTLHTWAEFVKLSHTIFALPFALAAMVVAARAPSAGCLECHRGWPGWRIFGLVLIAMVCARTCAMAFNRIVDRKFDALNPRTAQRHLPAGKLSVGSAWALWALSGAGLIATSYFLNPICFYLSPVALLVVCFYSLTKRFTDYTHVFLGIALALAPIGAWLAVRGEFGFVPPETVTANANEIFRLWAGQVATGLIPIVLALVVVFWLIGFDIIYALQDYEFDRRHGLRSLVVAWGPKNALRAAFLSHMITCGLLLVFGLFCRFRVAFIIGWIVIVACLMLEHWIARRRSLNWVQNAFFRLNAVVSLAFLGITVAEVVFQGGFRLK